MKNHKQIHHMIPSERDKLCLHKHTPYTGAIPNTGVRRCTMCGAVVRPILELSHNGDPYGSGFSASESNDGGHSWFYRGDIGARPRAWWRDYALCNDYILREAR